MLNAPLLVCSIISLLLSIAPLLWNFRQRNLAAILFIIYVIIGNICIIMNASVFGGPNVMTYWDGKIYCDIISRVQQVCSNGVAVSLAVVARTLAGILSRKVLLTHSPSDRRREIVIQLALCIGIPLVLLSLYYIYQPYRYMLIQFSGCLAAYDDSWVAFILFIIWQPVFALITSIYSGLTVYRYFRRRQEFRQILQSSQSGLTVSRFARLLFFCVSMVVVELPLSLYNLIRNVENGVHAFHWNVTHNEQKWSVIPRIPMTYTRPDMYFYLICSIMLFVYFGFGVDARTVYIDWMVKLGFRKVFPNSKWLAERSTTISTNSSGSNFMSTQSSTSKSEYYPSQNARPTRFDSWQDSADLEYGLDDDWNEKFGGRYNHEVTITGGCALAESRSHSITDSLNEPLSDASVRVKYEVRVT
ncbi:pheromone A receptor-domain-containing protein [Lipomyces arxii]|uniref:pheromone A receptor-domain-containing protein n=1 Tax=Lipomyces arxii TaxID=56418 RepID=UPI0034D01F4B